MKRLNLLNRCVRSFYFAMTLLLRFCGLNCFVYCSKLKVFTRKKYLTTYSGILSFFNSLLLIILLTNLRKTNCFDPHDPCSMRASAKVLMSLVARFHYSIHEKSLVALLKELFVIVEDISVLARHQNFFRFSHVVLCLLALQSMLRSVLIQLDPISKQQFSIWFTLMVVCVDLFNLLIFNVLVTVVLLLFIGLIACYDELHRCTRRISNDVRTLRMAQWRMEGGQRELLVQQLRSNLQQLIGVRARMFSITVRLIKFFRFHLVVSILYWIGHEVMIFISNHDDAVILAFWHVAIGLSNIAFYCTIFDIFVWKSKLSRSFWHLHLMSCNKDFDKTVDELLHRELVECVRVVAYGIPLNMQLFCKIFMLTIAYTLMRFAYKKV